MSRQADWLFIALYVAALATATASSLEKTGEPSLEHLFEHKQTPSYVAWGRKDIEPSIATHSNVREGDSIATVEFAEDKEHKKAKKTVIAGNLKSLWDNEDDKSNRPKGEDDPPSTKAEDWLPDDLPDDTVPRSYDMLDLASTESPRMRPITHSFPVNLSFQTYLPSTSTARTDFDSAIRAATEDYLLEELKRRGEFDIQKVSLMRQSRRLSDHLLFATLGYNIEIVEPPSVSLENNLSAALRNPTFLDALHEYPSDLTRDINLVEVSMEDGVTTSIELVEPENEGSEPVGIQQEDSQENDVIFAEIVLPKKAQQVDDQEGDVILAEIESHERGEDERTPQDVSRLQDDPLSGQGAEQKEEGDVVFAEIVSPEQGEDEGEVVFADLLPSDEGKKGISKKLVIFLILLIPMKLFLLWIIARQIWIWCTKPDKNDLKKSTGNFEGRRRSFQPRLSLRSSARDLLRKTDIQLNKHRPEIYENKPWRAAQRFPTSSTIDPESGASRRPSLFTRILYGDTIEDEEGRGIFARESSLRSVLSGGHTKQRPSRRGSTGLSSLILGDPQMRGMSRPGRVSIRKSTFTPVGVTDDSEYQRLQTNQNFAASRESDYATESDRSGSDALSTVEQVRINEKDDASATATGSVWSSLSKLWRGSVRGEPVHENSESANSDDSLVFAPVKMHNRFGILKAPEADKTGKMVLNDPFGAHEDDEDEGSGAQNAPHVTFAGNFHGVSPENVPTMASLPMTDLQQTTSGMTFLSMEGSDGDEVVPMTGLNWGISGLSTVSVENIQEVDEIESDDEENPKIVAPDSGEVGAPAAGEGQFLSVLDRVMVQRFHQYDINSDEESGGDKALDESTSLLN